MLNYGSWTESMSIVGTDARIVHHRLHQEWFQVCLLEAILHRGLGRSWEGQDEWRDVERDENTVAA
jgi:hypothetical protein